MPTTPPRRGRRASAEVRELLLRAARDEFLVNGYDGTTTKVIARRAGVSETVIFNHFTNKPNLFSAALLEPFSELISSYLADWKNDDPIKRIDTFVRDMSELGRQHRTVLISAMNRRLTDGLSDGNDILEHLASELQGIQGLTQVEEAKDFDIDPPVTLAVAAGMVLGVALLGDLLFAPGAARPDDDRLTKEMVTMLRRRVDNGQITSSKG